MFAYSLSSSLLLAVMYMAYKWMLASERQHAFNRVILWSIYIVALTAVPLAGAIPSLLRPEPQELIPLVEIDMSDLAVLPVDGLSGLPDPTGHTIGHTIARILLITYLVGVIAVTLHTLMVALRLAMIVRQGESLVIGGRRVRLISSTSIAPFSVMNVIVMSRRDFAEAGPMILAHECCHVRLRHWIDLLMAQLVAIFQWYNPASWLMREEMKAVHEYQADAGVIASGADVKQYQMLLIKKAVGARFPSLANSLNHSKLQKRITMMYQSKSRTAGKLGSLVLVPALAIGIAVVSIPAVASVISGASETTLLDSDSKVSKISANTESLAEMRAIAPASDNKAFTAVEKLAEFPGGIEAMMKWLQYNVKYPKEAEKAGEQGKAVVKFTVNKDGSISNATIIKSVSPSIDKEALRVVTSMPKWKPAENGGKKVACWYALPVSFRLAPDKETTKK